MHAGNSGNSMGICMGKASKAWNHFSTLICIMFYCGVYKTYTNVVLLLCVEEVLQDIILISLNDYTVTKVMMLYMN